MSSSGRPSTYFVVKENSENIKNIRGNDTRILLEC